MFSKYFYKNIFINEIYIYISLFNLPSRCTVFIVSYIWEGFKYVINNNCVCIIKST